MEIKLINNKNNEVLFSGETLNNKELNNKRFKLEIATSDGEVITRYTDFINNDINKKLIHIEGLTFAEVDLLKINDVTLDEIYDDNK